MLPEGGKAGEVRDDDKSQSVSRHHRQLRMELGSITAATLPEAGAAIITVTSEEDKY